MATATSPAPDLQETQRRDVLEIMCAQQDFTRPQPGRWLSFALWVMGALPTRVNPVRIQKRV